MANPEAYDAIVIGSGQGGTPLARALAKAGWRTAMIEREFVGGTCINFGCTPTKTMYNSARVAYLARRAADYGVHAGSIAVNMAEVRARKDGVVQSFGGSGFRGLAKANVDLVHGEAHFTGPHVLEVRLSDGGVRQLSADKIFINTGGRPAVPRIEGIDKVRFYDSRSI